MEHPFFDQNTLESLSVDEIQKKINELTKKLLWAHQSGNPPLCNQIKMVIESHQAILNQKLDKLYPKGETDFDSIIDIK
jgi:hypothetical protein